MTSSADHHTYTSAQLAAALDAAVGDAVRDAALQKSRKGILITRVDYDSYLVRLSSEVPFGTTRELDLLKQDPHDSPRCGPITKS